MDAFAARHRRPELPVRSTSSPPSSLLEDRCRVLRLVSASGQAPRNRHLADLRARSGLTTEQLIYRGRAEGWLVVSELEPNQ